MTLAAGQMVYDTATGRIGRIVSTTGASEVDPARTCVWVEPYGCRPGQEWLAETRNLKPREAA